MTVTLLMTIASFGTSWCIPALPVVACSMAQTVSMPSTTLPNHAVDDLAEDGVAEDRGAAAAVVEELVVGGVDEELGGGAVDLLGAGHGDGPGLVLQAVARLVLDRRAGRLLLHVGGQAASLDHEALDHPVEDRPLVEALAGVGEEVLDGDRRLGRVEFDEDLPLGGLHQDAGIAAAHVGSPFSRAAEILAKSGAPAAAAKEATKIHPPAAFCQSPSAAGSLSRGRGGAPRGSRRPGRGR